VYISKTSAHTDMKVIHSANKRHTHYKYTVHVNETRQTSLTPSYQHLGLWPHANNNNILLMVGLTMTNCICNHTTTQFFVCLVFSQHRFSHLTKDARKSVFYESYQKLSQLPIESIYDKLMAKKELQSHLGDQITSLQNDQKKARHLLDAIKKGIDIGIATVFESLLEAMGEYVADNSSELVTTLFASVQQKIDSAMEKELSGEQYTHRFIILKTLWKLFCHSGKYYFE